MATIQCEAKPFAIGSWIILRLPESASAHLPSRGQAMVEGTVNGFHFQTPLEPDGKGSHWFRVDHALGEAATIHPGDTVRVTMQSLKEWSDPELPADFEAALAASPRAHTLWQQITPMARWEWVRWTRSTGQQETRKRRIDVAVSKLNAGKRRPCCWNRNLCTEPAVSKNGVLLDPSSPV